MGLVIALVSICFCSPSDSSFASVTLIDSPLMSYGGSSWALNVNHSSKDIWFLSGYSCDNNKCFLNNYVFKYSIHNNLFYNMTPLPMSMDGWGPHFSFSNQETIYFIHSPNDMYDGTYDGIGDIGSYNINTKQWVSPITSVPNNSSALCVAADHSYMYLIGGGYPFANHDFHVLDFANIIWLQLQNTTKLNEARAISACQIHNGSIYVFGGYKIYDEPTEPNVDSIESFYIGFDSNVLLHLNSSTWKILPAHLSVGRYGIASVICHHVDPHLIYLFGGYGKVYSNLIEVFNTVNKSISTLPFTLNHARYAPAVVCVDEYIYIFGGVQRHDSAMTNWEISNPLYTKSPTALPTDAPYVYPTSEPSNMPSTMAPSEFPVRVTSAPTTGSLSAAPSKYPSEMPVVVTNHPPSSYVFSTTTNVVTNAISTNTLRAKENGNDQTLDTVASSLIGVAFGVSIAGITVAVYMWRKKQKRNRTLHETQIQKTHKDEKTVEMKADQENEVMDAPMVTTAVEASSAINTELVMIGSAKVSKDATPATERMQVEGAVNANEDPKENVLDDLLVEDESDESAEAMYDNSKNITNQTAK